MRRAHPDVLSAPEVTKEPFRPLPPPEGLWDALCDAQTSSYAVRLYEAMRAEGQWEAYPVLADMVRMERREEPRFEGWALEESPGLSRLAFTRAVYFYGKRGQAARGVDDVYAAVRGVQRLLRCIRAYRAPIGPSDPTYVEGVYRLAQHEYDRVPRDFGQRPPVAMYIEGYLGRTAHWTEPDWAVWAYSDWHAALEVQAPLRQLLEEIRVSASVDDVLDMLNHVPVDLLRDYHDETPVGLFVRGLVLRDPPAFEGEWVADAVAAGCGAGFLGAMQRLVVRFVVMPLRGWRITLHDVHAQPAIEDQIAKAVDMVRQVLALFPERTAFNGEAPMVRACVAAADGDWDAAEAAAEMEQPAFVPMMLFAAVHGYM